MYLVFIVYSLIIPFFLYTNTAQAREYTSSPVKKSFTQNTDNSGYPPIPLQPSQNPVMQSEVNQPNGVVGLDNAKKAAINNLVIQDNDANRLIQLKDGMPDYIAGAETSFIGGYTDSSGNTISRSLYVSGRPYGPIGAGCVLCIINSQDNIQGGGGRPAISGVDYNGGGHAVAEAGGFDQVGFYEFADNTESRIIAEVAQYENKKIILKTPLTPAQIKTIYPSMYIQTNSIDSSLPENNVKQGLLPATRNYATYVDHVSQSEPNVIYITGWAVPGNFSTVNHIPGNIYDTWASNYKKPVVFIGQPGKTFGRNLFLSYNGAKTRENAKSLIHAMEAEEIDMFIHDELRPHHVSAHGITISPIFANQNPDVLTADSYDMMLAGDIPNHLIIYEAPYNNVIKANSLYVHGNEGVGLISHGQKTKRIGFEHDQWSDGAHQFRFVNYLSKDGPSADWPDTSMHIGLLIDGTQGDINTGVHEGEIVWNTRDNNGGLSLCGGSGYCGLQQKFDGSLLLNTTYINTNQSLKIIKGGMLSFQSASNPNAITLNEDNEADLVFGSQSTGRVNLKGVNTILLNTLGVGNAQYNEANRKVSGTGTLYGWSMGNGASASTIINISPSPNTGGFKFYSLIPDSTLSEYAPIWQVDKAGNTIQPGILLAQKGIFSSRLVLYSPHTTERHPYLYAKDEDTITGGNSIGHKLAIEAGTFHSTEKLLVENGATFSPVSYRELGSGAIKGTQKYCSDCYSTLNPDHEKGIPVWWNGTFWADVLGKAVQH